jgi:hypothetical protein
MNMDWENQKGRRCRNIKSLKKARIKDENQVNAYTKD